MGVTIEICHDADHIVIRLDDLLQHLTQLSIQGCSKDIN